MFETEVLPVIEAHARQCFKDDERIAITIVLGWWIWSQRKGNFPPSVYARLAVRNARAGRDLPGVMALSKDAMRRGWQGAGMGQVMDRRPGPLEALILREEVEGITEGLTEGETALVEAIKDGIFSTTALAEHLEVSLARISQLKRQVATKKM